MQCNAPPHNSCSFREGESKGKNMREIAEFRIPEGNAARFLSKQDGKLIGTSSVRKVLAEVGSDLYNRIGDRTARTAL